MFDPGGQLGDAVCHRPLFWQNLVNMDPPKRAVLAKRKSRYVSCGPAASFPFRTHLIPIAFVGYCASLESPIF
jgi:hypothetical protein